jgi:putative transposase
MARKPRLHIPGALYRITLKGGPERPLFASDADRCVFEALLAETAARFGLRIHGYCWLDSRAELAVEVGGPPLSKALHALAFRYTRAINRRLGLAGPLFRGRYRAVLVEAEAYLPELVRHIHRAPVDAGLAADPADYPWSGHRAYLGLERVPWLTTARVYERIGGGSEPPAARYAAFMAAAVDDGKGLEGTAAGGRIPGGRDFVQAALGAAAEPTPVRARLASIVTAVCAARRLSWDELRAPERGHRASAARALVAYLAVETGAAPLARVARLFGRDLATLSHAASRLRARLDRDPDLAGEAARLLGLLEAEAKMKA